MDVFDDYITSRLVAHLSPKDRIRFALTCKELWREYGTQPKTFPHFDPISFEKAFSCKDLFLEEEKQTIELLEQFNVPDITGLYYVKNNISISYQNIFGLEVRIQNESMNEEKLILDDMDRVRFHIYGDGSCNMIDIDENEKEEYIYRLQILLKSIRTIWEKCTNTILDIASQINSSLKFLKHVHPGQDINIGIQNIEVYILSNGNSLISYRNKSYVSNKMIVYGGLSGDNIVWYVSTFSVENRILVREHIDVRSIFGMLIHLSAFSGLQYNVYQYNDSVGIVKSPHKNIPTDGVSQIYSHIHGFQPWWTIQGNSVYISK